MSAQQVLVIAIDVGMGITMLFSIAVAMEYRRAAAVYKERAEYFKKVAFDTANRQFVLGKKVPDFVAPHDPSWSMHPITTSSQPAPDDDNAFRDSVYNLAQSLWNTGTFASYQHAEMEAKRQIQESPRQLLITEYDNCAIYQGLLALDIGAP